MCDVFCMREKTVLWKNEGKWWFCFYYGFDREILSLRLSSSLVIANPISFLWNLNSWHYPGWLKKRCYREDTQKKRSVKLQKSSKVSCKIILTRMMEVLMKGIRKEQAGFRPGRSCVNQINTLRNFAQVSRDKRTVVHAFCWFLGRIRFPEERVYLKISEKSWFTREIRKHHQRAVKWACCVLYKPFEMVIYRFTPKTTQWVLFEFVCKKSWSAWDLEHFKLKIRIVLTWVVFGVKR